MAENRVPEFLVDNITNVTFANGVFRVAFARVGAENAPEAVATMFIPANQLSAILNGLNEAGKNIATQIQERTGDAQKEAAKTDDGGNGKGKK